MVPSHPCPTAPSQDDESEALPPGTRLQYHGQCTQQEPEHPNPFTARRAKDGGTPQSQGRCCCPRHSGRSMAWDVPAQRLHPCTAFICWALRWIVDQRASIQAFQISGALDSSNEVRPNDAARPPTLQRSSSDPDLLQCPALFQHTRQGEIKAAMGFSHRQKLPPIARTKHPKCRHSIQGHPAEHEPRPPALPVFQHDDQVVPKVQVGLEGTRCLERSAA